MIRSKNIVLIVVIVAIIVAIFIIQNPFTSKPALKIQAGEGINVGDLAPDFVLLDMNDNEIRLSDFRNKKAVVVNFWATWCPPCRQEMPAFESIFVNNKDKVEILGVNLQENKKTINGFLEEIPVTYTLLLDPTSSVKKTYNIFTQPVTYFIDKEGIIVDKKFGFLIDEEIEEKFKKIGINVKIE